MQYKIYTCTDPDNLNKHFPDLLELCFRYADTFSFTVNEAGSRRTKDCILRDKLRPYFVQKFHTYDWYGWCNADLEIFVYRCCGETKDILNRHCGGTFMEGSRNKFTLFDPPVFEDLCFYRGGIMLFGSLSHEFMCGFYPPCEAGEAGEAGAGEFVSEIGKIARWECGTDFVRYELPSH